VVGFGWFREKNLNSDSVKVLDESIINLCTGTLYPKKHGVKFLQ